MITLDAMLWRVFVRPALAPTVGTRGLRAANHSDLSEGQLDKRYKKLAKSAHCVTQKSHF